ncbi:ferritin-like domain-containing protein [Pseudonocardia petroleophila]|uniref:Ferritin-like domain-containing protein n=1 Tax=Pseudonocardia petroleophila TaxID=37331 RepID=A0A7G7MJ66_9PSEU|nr:ferritin-like domain-containing protein [Pseudonocardia petroleophila]QNG52827.1 ferritin-like domain-containing protein [Pseudonocardia petroleophila]
MFEGFSKAFVREAINRSAENAVDRRRFLRAAGLTGLGVAGVAGGGLALSGAAFASDDSDDGAATDAAVLNFALNLEYLEAEFYLRGAFGEGLNDDQIDGSGKLGEVTGGYKVDFESKLAKQYAIEIAQDERDHVDFLRAALGDAKVARPAIDLQDAFSAAAQAAGLVGPGEAFDVFANEDNFLLGAYVFEDVGVTAYKGASPLITNKTFLEAAAGILAVEAYHAGLVRTVLLAKGFEDAAGAISDARDSLDGPADLDQGIVDSDGNSNIVPTDENGIAYSRTAGQVLNIVYLNPASVTSGGFFPNGVNGGINTSDDNA